jgi:ubiquinone/menaquinone biosynthesis C-methylase UbiE
MGLFQQPAMGIYNRYILPRLINLAMQSRVVRAERARFVPLASGKVLEIGIGSGLNLPFYSRNVEKLYGLDPSRELWHLAKKRIAQASFPIEFIALSGEKIPLEDATFDSVVTTWTLCSIPDPAKALTEMRRVLKPQGQLIFIEHGLAPDPRVMAWQNRLTPLWQRIAGGCHLNRKMDDLIQQAGFSFIQIEKGYSEGPRPFTYLYKGLAHPD